MMRSIMSLSAFLGGYVGAQYYLAFWVRRHFALSAAGAAGARCTLLLLSLAFPLSMILHRHSDGSLARAFSFASTFWLGLWWIWLACALAGDLIELSLRWSRWAGPSAAAATWLIPVFTLAFTGWALYEGSRAPLLREVEIRLPGLPSALEGFTVLQLSDLHLESGSRMRAFARLVDRINALSPDLVALTGDMVDPGFGAKEELAALAGRLRARSGVFAVMGNHEFYNGARSSEALYRLCGFKLLRNEVVTLPSGLQIAGIDDAHASGAGRSEAESLLSRLDAGKPALYLSHQPLFFEAFAQKASGLMLSGHTHGGQIFPFGLIVRLTYPRFYGLYRAERSQGGGGAFLYVSSGAGTWGPPMRLFAPAEVVLFTFRSQQPAEKTSY
ncbi:MAG: metallophosphoesterase [Elusimicrobiota bacterium]|jgi:hypothetical protein